MSTYVAPSIKLHPLPAADGSVTYTSPSSTHTLMCGVNYPLEVPYRSDEDPESTYIEVSIRPHNGVSMVKERYVEDVVCRTLKTVVLGEDTPRSMLQCTIQIIEVQEDETLPGGIKGGYQGERNLDLVVGAVNASILGCLDGAVRMRGLVGAVLVGIASDSTTLISPNIKDRLRCESLHAFGFDSTARCVLTESEGRFDLKTWARAEKVARQAVCGSLSAAVNTTSDSDEDTDMEGTPHDDCLFNAIRSSFVARKAHDERWQS